MDNARITYRQRSTTPQEACDARARAWGYVFRCYEAKKGVASASSTDSDEERKGLRSSETEKGGGHVDI